ncbi:MAG: FadR/GntR family transcriptional regulator [Anaerolineales bacterium]|nr:MAG: FadR/GntR family transcriptional regulator [Anaerolineales bacterium]
MKLIMKPINRVPLVNQVVESLIDHIKREDVTEGSKLPTEAALCDSLAVGRGTIREAFRVLNTRGYVTLISGRGAFVASKVPTLHQWFQVNELELRSVFEVRYAIEPLAISLAIENATHKDIKKLHQSLAEAKELLISRDSEKLTINDEKFHSLIASMSGNSLLVSINMDIQRYLHEFRLRTFLLENNRNNYYPAHKAIVDAFDAHDAKLGEEYMARHLQAVSRDLEKSKAG